MTERIIENWLDKAAETTFQIPFCYMLANEGYTVLHLTRHCGMEQGKDILAVTKDGTACAFQLKGAPSSKIKLKEWQNEINGQITQLVFTPIFHPSINGDKHHQSFLVTNGELEEEVSFAINSFNIDWKNKGQPQYKIETIVRGQLLEMANKLKTNFIPTEVEDFKALLEFYLEDGKGILNKRKFSALLNTVFKEEKSGISESKRTMSSAALLCSLATSNYTNQNNHIAVAEAWTIYLSTLLRYCQNNDIEQKLFKNEIEIAIQIVINALENLLEEVLNLKHFFVGNPIEDAFIHNARVTWIIGFLSSLGLYYKLTSQNTESIEIINQVITSNKVRLDLFGESAVPNFVSYYWFVRDCINKEKGIEIITSLLTSIVQVGKTPNLVFPNVYYNIDEAISLSFEIDKRVLQKVNFKQDSHVLEPLINLAVRQNLKELLVKLWPDISKNFFAEFCFQEKTDYYLWRNTTGKEIFKIPNSPENWDTLVNSASEVDGDTVPELLKSYPYLIPIFLIVYPHRFNNSVVRWFDSISGSSTL